MLLLIDEPRDDRDDDAPIRRPSLAHVPWRPFAWVAVFCWLMFAAGRIGGFPGYLVVLGAIALCSWRLDRALP